MDKNDAKVGAALANLVHSIVNHQSKVDRAWYEATVAEFDGLGVIPGKYVGDDRKALLQSLFSEVLALTVMSHTINSTFLALGRETPPLPTRNECSGSDGAPTMVPVTSLLKPGRTLRTDKPPSIGYVPYVLFGDLDMDRVREEFCTGSDDSDGGDSARFEKSLKMNLDPHLPTFGASLSFGDIIMCMKVMNVFYGGMKVRRCSVI